jgi:small neutral amino acid transporter SnatA (MarC family)
VSDAVLAILALVAAVNPAAQAARPEPEGGAARPSPLLAAGAAAVAGAIVLLLRSPFLDLLDISGSSFQLAAGFIMIAAGVPVLLYGRAQALDVDDDTTRSLTEAIVWYALNPAVLAGLVALPDRSNLGVTIAGFALALALGAAAAFWRARRAAPIPLAASAGRLTAFLLMAIGVSLAVSGVQSI